MIFWTGDPLQDIHGNIDHCDGAERHAGVLMTAGLAGHISYDLERLHHPSHWVGMLFPFFNFDLPNCAVVSCEFMPAVAPAYTTFFILFFFWLH